jgi:type IV pilus assembly protein PilB
MGNGDTAEKKYVRWHKKLGAYLLAAGLVDEQTLTRALEMQRKQRPPKTKIGKLLIDMGMTDDINIAKTLASQLNIEFIHVSNLKIPKDVLALIPASIAEASLIVPISKKGKKMIVAMANPLEQYVIDDLRFITQMDVEIAVAPETEMIELIDRYYTNGIDDDLNEFDIDSFLEVIEEENIEEDDVQNLIGLTEQAPVVKFTNHILANAIKYKASDIHIEPRYSDTMIRYRIDGIMREILQASKKSHFSVVARVKIISNMDISIRRKPQDGRAMTWVSRKKILILLRILFINRRELYW